MEKENLLVLLKDISFYYKTNRVLWKPFFEDVDKTHRGKIFFDRFRALMYKVGIKFTEEGFKLISKAFTVEKIEFDYLIFDKCIKTLSDEIWIINLNLNKIQF